MKKFLSFLLICVFLFSLCFCLPSKIYVFPVTRGDSNTPLAQVKIENYQYPATFDLGSKLQLELTKNILSKLKKKRIGTIETKTIKGIAHHLPTYLIPEIKIGDHIYKNITAAEINDAFISEGCISNNTCNEKISGQTKCKIGRPLFEKMNLLLDFPNSKIIECDDFKNVQKLGYQFRSKIPIKKVKTGWCFTAISDLGLLRLSIDTGCTQTLIRPELVKECELTIEKFKHPFFKTSTFKIGDNNYAEYKLMVLTLPEELHAEIDGILGMDFLQDHAMYIDHKNGFLYL